ncbi:MAG TPA: hypothetical protein VFF79_08225, partial [Conexibacter sp.]|nr:hypothetical protein [Conexibacter sp.]
MPAHGGAEGVDRRLLGWQQHDGQDQRPERDRSAGEAERAEALTAVLVGGQEHAHERVKRDGEEDVDLRAGMSAGLQDGDHG